MNLETHPRGPHFSVNEAATMAKAKDVGVVDPEDTLDAHHAVDAVDMADPVDAVDLETCTKVSAPIAKLTAILQMHAGSGNEPRREETMKEMMGAFVSVAGSQDMSKSIASPTNI
jgi:hypothetical protein